MTSRIRKPELTALWTSWDAYEEVTVRSRQDARTLVDRTAKIEPPALIEFCEPNDGPSFGIGLGRSMTVLTFQETLDPPYFISLGDRQRDGVEWFCYGNERTEYLAANLISIEQGLAAVKHFVENGTKPQDCDWEML
jgi:hypothetical protein